MGPFENLVALHCNDCNWTRRTQPQNKQVLTLLGYEHITQTGGHNVEWENPNDAIRS
jgi:hypothetical protein